MSTAIASMIHVRPMTTADLDQGYALSAALRWPHRREDWAALLQLGLGYVAERDNAVIGTIMFWAYGQTAASLGMVIVADNFQGLGIGRNLMRAVLDAAGERSVNLRATEDGRPLYEKLGFTACGFIHQHQGSGFAAETFQTAGSDRLRPMRLDDRNRLIEIDRAVTGLERNALYASLFADGEGIVLERDGKIAGFTIVRQFGLGFCIGPVIATDVECAKRLISYGLSQKTDQFMRLDVPHTSGLSEWLDSCGLKQVGRLTSMLRGQAPVADSPLTQFAIVGQAKG
ncbi:GNAT family N-acetyltransferase [Massilia cavernae]|uniref:N-acetyltransferase n=1 Tax=Massilia cavernae TaxID=2320864 RepID=A0A418Y7G9_9BURK|nr:GNAT family N-acetyltransferase [Massilia cavernae]RJG26320.1 N-acetyltransferase [Massilia cavernae]